MGVRIDGSNDVVSAADGSLTVDGLSLSVTGIITASGGFKVGSAYTAYSNGNVETTGIVTTSGGLNVTDGNVGIGTNIAGTLLELNGKSTKEATVTFNRQPVQGTNDGTIGQFIFENNTDSVALLAVKRQSAADDAYFQFATQATGGGLSEKLRIDSSGRLLIGADGASNLIRHGQLFAVATTDEFGGGSFTGFNGTTANEGPIIDLQRSRATSKSPGTVVVDGDRLGSLVFRGDDGSDFADAAYMLGEVDGTPSGGFVPGRFTFFTGTTSATPTERLRITSAGQVRIGSFGAPSNKNSVTPLSHVDGSGVNGGFQVNRHTSVGGGGAQLLLSATRGSSITGHTVLQDGDGIGTVEFLGSDGGEFVPAARIQAQVDATPGNDDMPGRLIFSTTADGASGPTERMRILSGGGLTFNGDTAQANALDDYEEGDWTPDLQFGGAKVGITYGNQYGKYIKIGRLVHVHGRITLTSKGSSGGNARFFGLPYVTETISGTTMNIGSIWYSGFNLQGSIVHVVIRTDGNGNSFIEPKGVTTNTEDAIGDTDFTNTTDMCFSITYRTA